MRIVWRAVLFASLLANAALAAALVDRAWGASDLGSRAASLEAANAFLLELVNASIDGNCALRRARTAEVARRHGYAVDWDARYANMGPFMATSAGDCLLRVERVGL